PTLLCWVGVAPGFSRSISAQMPREELARGREDTAAVLPPGLRPAARMFAHLHPERSCGLVQICLVEERMRQTVYQPQRHVLPCSLERFVQQNTLTVR